MDKACFKCGAVKSLTDFYKHKAMKDGHLNKCKSCTKKDARKHRDDNLEKVKEYDRNRSNKDARNEAVKSRYKDLYGKDEGYTKGILASKRAYSETNRNKKSASVSVNNAIRDGKLFKPDVCSSCRESGVDIEGHHWSYKKRALARCCLVVCLLSRKGARKAQLLE